MTTPTLATTPQPVEVEVVPGEPARGSACPVSCQRRSSPRPFWPPTQWYQIVMPLAAVWSIQISASALDLATLRQRTVPQVDQAPVTFVMVRCPS